MNLDAIVFAAHPDDAELSMGGTIAKMTASNFKVGIVDFTKGEMGTRGTPEIREEEARKAGDILKISLRENLLIPDGNIADSEENLMSVIKIIRKYKPRVVFAPYFNDRHPDHIDTSKIVKKALFQTGLDKVKTFDNGTAQTPFRPSHLYYYMQTYTFEPSFIVDITNCFETKMKAIRTYKSQFYNPQNTEPETFISGPDFIRYIESRAHFYGFQIRKSYGEPFYSEEEIELDLISLLKK
jgi:bacillithiol biosynthesis deacetylase BshB1